MYAVTVDYVDMTDLLLLQVTGELGFPLGALPTRDQANGPLEHHQPPIVLNKFITILHPKKVRRKNVIFCLVHAKIYERSEWQADTGAFRGKQSWGGGGREGGVCLVIRMEILRIML